MTAGDTSRRLQQNVGNRLASLSRPSVDVGGPAGAPGAGVQVRGMVGVRGSPTPSRTYRSTATPLPRCGATPPRAG
jgi:hypothetical protein